MDISAALEKKFVDTLGINTAAIGRAAVERIISQALKRAGIADAKDYLDLLSRSPDEVEHCLEALVVPETWFFRDREPFLLLKRHLCEEWFPAHPGETARLLSLPCSTGEEPYSIAITLLQAGIFPVQFRLDAADISRRALAAARRAEYGKAAFREPLTPAQELFFKDTARGRKVVDDVVRTVHFRRENIIDPDLLARSESYQVIFCRNVLIYLTEEARGRVLANIDRLLAPGGMIFTGHAEVGIFQQKGYQAVRHPRAFACRRTVKPPAAGDSLGEYDEKGKGFKSVPFSSILPAKRSVKRSHRPVADRPPAPPLTLSAESAAGALYAEARSLADRGLFAEAEARCRRYLRELPPHADAYSLLGLIHEAAGRSSDAEECYLKALYLDPDHYGTLVHLSLLYRQRGEGRKASLMLRRAESAERRPNGTVGP